MHRRHSGLPIPCNDVQGNQLPFQPHGLLCLPPLRCLNRWSSPVPALSLVYWENHPVSVFGIQLVPAPVRLARELPKPSSAS